MDVKIFDNVVDVVRDDMASTISKGSKVSIAAACFSMYAYKELKKQLSEPVWQAGPSFFTSTSKESESQSYFTETTF